MSTEEAAEPEVLVEQRDRILIITINRPKAKNAVDSAVAHGLADAVDSSRHPGLSVGIVTGAGGTFCAGMDLKAFPRGEVPIVEGRGMGFTERGPTSRSSRRSRDTPCRWHRIRAGHRLIVASRDASLGTRGQARTGAGGGGMLAARTHPPAIAMEWP